MSERAYRLEPPAGITCGTFGCDALAVIYTLRGEEWFPGWYCAEHGTHARSTDPEGKPLNYCANCFQDWPCPSAKADS